MVNADTVGPRYLEATPRSSMERTNRTSELDVETMLRIRAGWSESKRVMKTSEEDDISMSKRFDDDSSGW
jgi:hypothetical protein